MIRSHFLAPLLFFITILGTNFCFSQDEAEAPLSPHFLRHVIDDQFTDGYQVNVADINRDGLPDVIALSTEPARLVWYRNPEWTRFVITSESEKYIDAAPFDVDGDGDTDLALASEFDLRNSTKGGDISWLECGADPTVPWKLHPIDSAPTSHRIRWADIDGDQRPELVNLPIVGVGAKPPDYGVPVDFKAYIVPEKPREEAWTELILDRSLHMAHGLRVIDWDSDGADELLTASFEGVHLFQKNDTGWEKTRLGSGKEAPRPAQGSSEVALGYTRGIPFITTIEPWHGNEVVVYRRKADEKTGLWQRTVVDDQFNDGHALATADLDGDGDDEIIAGHRGRDYCLFVFRYTSRNSWEKTEIDHGGISAAGIFVSDLNGDSRLDIIGVGSATANVLWYENLSP